MSTHFQFIPIFSVILKQKLLCLFIIIIPLFILLIHIFDIYHYSCLFYSTTKIPCSACGLTRAFNHILTGEWYTAIKLHLLVPVLFLFWFIVLILTILPQKPRKTIIGNIQVLEQKTGFFLWFLIIYFCYGIVRISVLTYNVY